MKKIMYLIFLSCFKATELIEKELHFKLSIHDRVQLKLHKSMCKACKQYEKQSVFLEQYMINVTKSTPSNTDIAKLKSAIKAKIGTQE